VPDDTKLLIRLQLVGLTAVLFFCWSALGTFNLAQSLWLKHETIESLPIENQLELYAPLILFATVCAASLYTFVALVFRTVRNAALISIVYLLLLLLFLVIQIVSTLLASLELHIPQQVLVIWLGVRVLCATWVVGLLAIVWPNYSLKRTAANRHGVD
jgi:hypothetical protein